MFVEVFKSFGAAPTPMPGSQMFMALKTGMVDGEDNGVINLVAGPNVKVIKHFTPINWSRSGVAAWISVHTWNELTKQQKQWITEASAIAAKESKFDYEIRLKEAYAKLPELGIALHRPDIESFKRAVAGFETKYDGTAWPLGLADKVRKLDLGR